MNLNSVIPVHSSRRFSQEGFSDLHQQLTEKREKFPLYVQLPNDTEIYVLEGESGEFHVWHFRFHQRVVGEDSHFDGCTVTNTSVHQTFAEAVDGMGSWIKANFCGVN